MNLLKTGGPSLIALIAAWAGSPQVGNTEVLAPVAALQLIVTTALIGRSQWDKGTGPERPTSSASVAFADAADTGPGKLRSSPGKPKSMNRGVHGFGVRGISSGRTSAIRHKASVGSQREFMPQSPSTLLRLSLEPAKPALEGPTVIKPEPPPPKSTKLEPKLEPPKSSLTPDIPSAPKPADLGPAQAHPAVPLPVHKASPSSEAIPY